MELYDFPYFTIETENPQSGYRGSFGGSYLFSTPPQSPDQRKFTLDYPTMVWYVDGQGNPDATINPQNNMLALSQFYQRNKLWNPFQFNHPMYGLLVVQFNKPLVEVRGLPGGFGAVQPFTVELLEIP